MADSLTVELNREGLYDVAAPARFETDGDFRLQLRNHGEPTHVHVRVDDALAAVLRPAGVNHYVEAESERAVAVRTDPNRTDETTGTVEVAVGHGAERAATEVTLLEPGARDVTVGESLREPSPSEPDPRLGEYLRPAALGALSVLLLAWALLASGPLALLVGALALLVAGGALYSL